jgi:hypothetical protein
MEVNPENIPAHVFDWIGTFAFNELNTQQKEEAGAYLTEQQYNALHAAARGVKVVATESFRAGAGRKASLLDRFDEHHASVNPLRRVMLRPVALWKVASLFILGGISGAFLLQAKPPVTDGVGTTRHDTVYVNREVLSPSEKIHDTVYILGQQVPARDVSVRPPTASAPKGATFDTDIQDPGSINVITLRDYERKQNGPRGNSMKDDSLLRSYTFVTLL